MCLVTTQEMQNESLIVPLKMKKTDELYKHEDLQDYISNVFKVSSLKTALILYKDI